MNTNEALSHATETKLFEVGSHALERVPEYLQRLGVNGPVVLVGDENTFAAAGERLGQLLSQQGIEVGEPIIYPGLPVLHAEYQYISALKDKLSGTELFPIAVGSGTINDIVKRTVWELGRRYVSVGTAVSMDGYTSAGAAIVKDGFKQTLECSAPLGIVGDLEVFAGAPASMTAAGYGDLFAKIVAGADWILADEIGVDPIDPLAWSMVQDDLRAWLSTPDGCAAGDPDSLKLLYTGLSLTGFAMQAIHKSRPASGAEHQLSHIWEMEGLEMNGVPVSHGLKVAIGSLASCALFELLDGFDFAGFDIQSRIREWPSWEKREAEVDALVAGTVYAEQTMAESKRKYVDAEALGTRLEGLQKSWDQVRERLRKQLYPYDEMRDMLRRAGCPVDPEQIGLTRERAVHTIILSQLMRERYTVLDLLYELGLLNEFAQRISSSDRFWR